MRLLMRKRNRAPPELYSIYTLRNSGRNKRKKTHTINIICSYLYVRTLSKRRDAFIGTRRIYEIIFIRAYGFDNPDPRTSYKRSGHPPYCVIVTIIEISTDPSVVQREPVETCARSRTLYRGDNSERPATCDVINRTRTTSWPGRFPGSHEVVSIKQKTRAYESTRLVTAFLKLCSAQITSGWREA